VALLRASSSALGDELDVAAALTRGEGVRGGPLLLDFAAAAHLGTPDLPTRRADVEAAFGETGLVEACLTIGAFNGLTRVADATGIVLDGGTLAATVDVRAQLAFNDMAGALSTGAGVHDTGAPRTPKAVAELFADELK
jgi:hypothetical protein